MQVQGRIIKYTNMTLATADSFELTRATDVEKNIQHRVGRAAHNSNLQDTGNLLDWKSQYADIKLQPTSCIDLYTDLVLRGNTISLMPASSELNTQHTHSTHTRIDTAHADENLRLRCRKLEVDTDPGKINTAFKLYLAAGFLVYQSNGETKRAPLVLIPVTMQRLRGRASLYGVKCIEGSQLRLNPHVADMCNSHTEQLIKPFHNTVELREYLRNIITKVHSDYRSRVTANTGIIRLHADKLANLSQEDQITIELERTRPGAAFTPMPATPASFDPQLALKILRFTDSKNLSTTLATLSGQLDQKRSYVSGAVPDLDADTLQKFHNCASWLIDVGLGDWQLKNIAALPCRVQLMQYNIDNLLANKAFNDNFRAEHRTVDMLYRLNKTKEKILNAPLEMQHHSIALHAEADTVLYMQQAKIQASSLTDQMTLIRDTFGSNPIPSSSTLGRLISIISRRENESQLTNPEYFRARRTLNELLGYSNGALTDNDIDQLDKIAKTQQFAETFNSDPYYKRHFGSLFKGAETNWQRLDSVVSFTQMLAKELGSARLVAQFADRWVSFERDFSSFATDIEAAASSAHKLCSLLPTLIKQETTLKDASRTAEKYRCRINQWQKFLRQNYADIELTPLQMMSDFELGEYQHPDVSLPQQDYDERIYRHIVGHRVCSDSVAATASWLEYVIDELQTDTAAVRRFLNREASLHTCMY